MNESLDQAALAEAGLDKAGPCPEPSPVLICDSPPTVSHLRPKHGMNLSRRYAKVLRS